MIFRTELSIPAFEAKISHQSKVVLLGSCFSENMSQRFEYFKFDVHSNPFGTIFNSFSLLNLIKRTIQKNYFTIDEVIFHHDIYQNVEVHSSMSQLSAQELLQKLNQTIDSFYEQLRLGSHLFITLGTSWVYQELASGNIVANCHKIPQNKFEKKLISTLENYDYLDQMVQILTEFNPKLAIIFTVSPVRHLKDGMIENQVSKSNLISAVYQILQKNKEINYFPSYELVMDDLRDYRFFTADLLHPNELAIQYIWEKLTQSFCSENTIKLMKEIDVIQKSLSHKPFNPDTESHRKFEQNLQLKIQQVKNKIPQIKF